MVNNDAARTITSIMSLSITNEILSWQTDPVQICRIDRSLRQVPEIITEDPSRIASLGQEGCCLTERDGRQDRGEKRRAHLDDGHTQARV